MTAWGELRGRALSLALGCLALAALALPVAAAAEPSAQASVVGGRAGSITEFPWLAFIEAHEGKHGFACTGSVVAPRVVLTAAHCVESLDRGGLTSAGQYALATGVTDYARRLVDRFWPGPLTLVCNQQPSLQWDLGDTRGTVAVRMPDHRLALDLLERTGPMAVSSANLTGHPASVDADMAEEMLADHVAVIIDDGPSPGGSSSTIVDVRGHRGKVLRTGAISLEELNEALEDMDKTIEDED